jgi:carboxylesterase type B
MFKSTLTIFLLSSLSSALAFEKCSNDYTSAKVLETNSGRIAGECRTIPLSYSNSTKTQVQIFTWLSVPFAEPPTNENRFKPPLPKKPWNSTLNGTAWPNACMQAGNPRSSEDCLYLNIFSPASAYLNKQNLAPILVFIHGGGFVVGRTSSDIFEPSSLAAHSGIVVVTIQYRLDSFGFLYLSESEAVGNQALLDQSLALRWIHENAARFGGDSSRISLSGESAGSWSVGYHLVYRKSWPYFRNAIMGSGAPTYKSFPLLSPTEATRRAKDLLGYLGCNRSSSNREIIECAQRLEANSILNATQFYLNDRIFINGLRALSSLAPFAFVFDNRTFTKPIEESLARGEFKKCSLITGSNTNEFAFFLPSLGLLGDDPAKWDAMARNFSATQLRGWLSETFHFYPSYPARSEDSFVSSVLNEYMPSGQPGEDIYLNYYSHILSDFVFTCPVLQMAEIYSRAKLSSYVYSYNFRISTSVLPEVLGVAHVDELAVVFAEPLGSKEASEETARNPWSSANHEYSSEEKKFTEDFLVYWTNFIKHNDPNYGLSRASSGRWRTFFDVFTDLDRLNASQKENGGAYMMFNRTSMRSVSGYGMSRCSFWNYTRDGSRANQPVSVWSSLVDFIYNFLAYLFSK